MIEPLSFISRIRLPQSRICTNCLQQTRNATLIKRPKRPYTFTQLVVLSDGSSYLHRTTSPQPVFRATKDIKNSKLWNPSDKHLNNLEEDEAGKLAAFRSRFGADFEMDSADVSDGNKAEAVASSEESTTSMKAKAAQAESPQETSEDDGWGGGLMDMISASSQMSNTLTRKKGAATKAIPDKPKAK